MSEELPCCCAQHSAEKSCPCCPAHSPKFVGAQETKPTNPKEAFGNAKPYASTVPFPFLFAVGSAMVEGAAKYRRHNYRIAGVKVSTYVDACLRHLAAYWEGENTDPDSGLPHVIKAAACLAVLYDSTVQGNLSDDRPPKSPEGWMREESERMRKLLAKHPNPKEPCTEADRKK